MRLTRRTLLGSALSAGAAGLILPRRVWAATMIELDGGVRIDTLSDGVLQISADAPPTPCQVTLLRDGTNTVLFDAGGGPDFVPTLGLLLDALGAVEVAPEDVTHVVFTHAHPDHFWGILDEFDEPAFPNAALLMGQVERDYWADPATVAAQPEARKSFAVGAARRIEALGDRLAVFADGDEVVPGVVARLTPGHTPGHMAFVAAVAMILGDAATSVQAIEAPDTPGGFDTDPGLAAATRKALLPELAASGMPVVGFHLPEGGIGKVLPGEGAAAFRWQPL